MSTSNIYRVEYWFESGGKRISETFMDNVLAATSDYSTISAVLSGNGKNNGGHGTLVIGSIGNANGIAANGVIS